MSDVHNDPERAPDGIHNLTLPGCVVTKSYRGERLADGTFSVAVELSTILHGQREPMVTTFHPLPLSVRIRSHSPTGFAWGYDGSGPAQLALALIVDAVGDVDLALRYYQDFKRVMVATWSHSWSISADAIRQFVADREQANRDAFAE